MTDCPELRLHAALRRPLTPTPTPFAYKGPTVVADAPEVLAINTCILRYNKYNPVKGGRRFGPTCHLIFRVENGQKKQVDLL